MKSVLSILFILCLCNTYTQSQTLQISGNVRDSLSKPLGFASVVVYKGTLSRVVSFGTSNTEGYFELNFKPDTTHYFLTVNMLGYARATEAIQVNLPSPKKIEKDFILKEQNLELNTVVVNADRPVQQKGDTLTYNVDAIKNNSERTLEDVLKKLPGVSIAQDGAVSVNGKEIKSLLIEGEDIFQENYKIGTRNIPAGVIDQIQAIDNHQRKSQLRGLEDSNDMVLNIKLKKDKKSIFFGDIAATYGLDNRREIHSNLFSIQPKNKLYLITQHNNLGIAPLDLLSKSASKNQRSAPQLIGIPQSNLNDTRLSNQRANLNEANFAYLSGIISFSQKIRLNHSNLFISDKNTRQFTNNSQALLNSQNNFSTEETQNSIFKPTLFNSRLGLSYDISPQSNLELSSEWKSEWNDYKNDIALQINLPEIILPTENTSESMNLRGKQWVNQLNYVHRLDSNQAFTANLYYTLQRLPQVYQANSERFASLFSLESEFDRLSQNLDFQTQLLGSVATYLLKKKGIKYNFRVGSELTFTDLDSGLGLSSDTESVRIRSDFANQLIYRTSNYFVEGNLSKKILKKINLTTSILLRRLGAGIEDDFAASQSTQKNIIFLEPKVSLSIPVGEASLIASYTFKRNLPQVRDVFSGSLFQNYRAYQQGAEELIFPSSHTFILGYFWLSLNRNLFFNTSLIYMHSPESFGQRIQIDPFFSSLNRIIVNGNQNVIYILSFDKYLPPISSALKLEINLFWLLDNNQLGTDTPTENRSYNGVYALSYRSLFNGFINLEAKAQFTDGRSSNQNGAESPFKNQNLLSQYTFKSILQPKSKKWQYILSAERFLLYNQEVKVFDYYFLDAEFLHYFLDKKLEVSLLFRNLFNNTQFERVRLDNFFVSTQSQDILPRLLMLRVKYAL